jgi:hypothetical protein
MCSVEQPMQIKHGDVVCAERLALFATGNALCKASWYRENPTADS